MASRIGRRLSENTFWLMPARSFFRSLNRQGRASRLRKINNFHLLPMRWTVVATGQAGISSLVRMDRRLFRPVFLFLHCTIARRILQSARLGYHLVTE